LQRKDNIIMWGVFCFAFIGSYMVLLQQSESIANNAYLISAFIALSLMFIADRILKNRQTSKDKNSGPQKKSRSKKASGKQTMKIAKEKTDRVVSVKHSKSHASKGKKKK